MIRNFLVRFVSALTTAGLLLFVKFGGEMPVPHVYIPSFHPSVIFFLSTAYIVAMVYILSGIVIIKKHSMEKNFGAWIWVIIGGTLTMAGGIMTVFLMYGPSYLAGLFIAVCGLTLFVFLSEPYRTTRPSYDSFYACLLLATFGTIIPGVGLIITGLS
jgi:hypothetical protein